MGPTSATGAAFTRKSASGENVFYGEGAVQRAQGEDEVAGIRTPNALNEVSKTDSARLPALAPVPAGQLGSL
ncbi:MAG: hypothetical protein AAF560_28365 [Acidobacteriota bacterium]